MPRLLLILIQVGPFSTLLLAYLIHLVYSYRFLPNRIATTFDSEDHPKSWMAQGTWALVSTLVWVLLAIAFASIYLTYTLGKQSLILPALAVLYMCAGVLFSVFMQILASARTSVAFRFSRVVLAGVAGLIYGVVLQFVH